MSNEILQMIEAHRATLTRFEILLSDENIALLDKLASFGHWDSASSLVEYLVHSIVDGAHRPGSWERGIMYPLGIESHNEIYRHTTKELFEHYKAIGK